MRTSAIKRLPAPATNEELDDSVVELTKLYIEAKDEQRQWETLVSVAAHELRHPLHLMRLALARYFPEPNARGRDVLERYIDRMSRVIGDMTDYVRIEQNELALEFGWVDIIRLVREVVDAYVPDAALRRVKLTVEGFTSPVWIKADDQRLLQVLWNVLDNALKFTPNGGSIAVTTVRSKTAFEIRVRDNGQGIAPDRVPHVFDLFVGADGPRGLGIGLAVARRIIDLHNGMIEIYSDGIDRGSEVIIQLPITESSPP